MGKPAIDLSQLSLDERLALLDELVESIRRTPTLLSHPDAVCREVDRKLDALMKEGPLGANWDQPLQDRPAVPAPPGKGRGPKS